MRRDYDFKNAKRGPVAAALGKTSRTSSPRRRGSSDFELLEAKILASRLTVRQPVLSLLKDGNGDQKRGSFQKHPLIAFAAATTLVIGAAYTLWLVKRVVFGEVGNAHVAELEDINPREVLVLGTFAIGVLFLGVWPKPLTDLMEPSIAQLATQIAASKL